MLLASCVNVENGASIVTNRETAETDTEHIPIVKTMEIMGDVEMMDALRRGIRDVQEGNIVSLDEVKSESGIAD